MAARDLAKIRHASGMDLLKLALPCAIFTLLLGCSRSEPEKAATPPTSAVTSTPAAAAPAAPVTTSPAETKPVVDSHLPSPTALVTAASSGATPAPAGGPALDLSSGVKEALEVAGNRAVEELSGPNGFQKNLIPLPATVEKTRPYLKAAGKEELLTQFSTAINSAAANAIKQSPEVLNSTVRSMQLSDVTTLWQGQSDAFTRYLEKNARTTIVERMMPTIKAATEASGATQAFKQINASLGQKAGGLLTGFQAGFQAATGVELPNANFDLDAYVADQAMNGLFNTMAVEEKKLRENPSARSSQLLKTLFSRFQK